MDKDEVFKNEMEHVPDFSFGEGVAVIESRPSRTGLRWFIRFFRMWIKRTHQMNSRLSRLENVLLRVVRWSFPASFILNVVVAWWLQGKHGLFLRWIEIQRYLALIYLVFAITLLGQILKQRSITGAILIFLGGLFFAGFVMFVQPWMLLIGLGVSMAGGIWMAMPQLREIFHRLSTSYRAISASSKT